MTREQMIDWLIFMSKPFYNDDEHQEYIEELNAMNNEQLEEEYFYRVDNQF